MDSREVIALIVCITSAVCQTRHGRDNSVCTPSPVGAVMPKPNISAQFHCFIELVLIDKNKTTLIEEYFDSINNRAYVRQKNMDIDVEAWYDYETNEFITFFPQAPVSAPGRCSVDRLSNSTNKYMFGYKYLDGIGHIFNASAALHFSGQGINNVYKGRTTVRDIQVDWWQSCQYWNGLDATMIVDYYFTVSNTWNSSAGIQVPVQAHVRGVSYTNGKHYFDHVYNFYEFRPYIGEDETQVFETPTGVICPGRKYTKRLPTPPDHFSITLEILDVNRLKTSIMKETLNFERKLIMYEYRPDAISPYGNRDLIEIHDFNTGVAYIRDKIFGNCSFRSIEEGFDSKSVGPERVRMRTAREYFYFDTGVSYEGVKLYRHVDCDTWIANRTDFPSYFPHNSTWEWYFPTDDWVNKDVATKSLKVPICLSISVPDLNLNYQYNIFNVRQNELDLLKLDISSCYEFKMRRKFQLGFRQVSETAMRQIQTNIDVSKFTILKTIMEATGMSLLRVANIQLKLTTIVTATFELLDVTPISGNTGTSFKEVPLDFAANTLLAQVHNGQFVVLLNIPNFKTINLIADPNGVVEITYTNVTSTTSTTASTTASTTPSTSSTPGKSLPSTSVHPTTPLISSTSKSTTKSASVTSSLPVSASGSASSSSSLTSSVSSSATSSISKHTATNIPAIRTTGGGTTSGVAKANGKDKQSTTDNTARALSITGVALGTVIAGALAVYLVVYLKRSGKIRVPGQNNSSGFDNVAFSSTACQVDLQTDS